MFKRLTITACFCGLLLAACSKHNDGADAGAPIADLATAKLAFGKINSLWTGTLKPALSKSNQQYTGKVLTGSAGGTATVYGRYTHQSYTGSTSSSASSTLDATIRFEKYEMNGLRLDGVLRFYDYYSTRTSCGSAGCATSTHTGVDYDSKDTTGAALPAITIRFTNGGAVCRDAILLVASKPYSTFSVKLTNGAQKLFSFSY